MKNVKGFLFLCVLMPSLYGVAAYYLATHKVEGGLAPNKGFRLALLIALPVAAVGVVHWRDVWVSPLPKLGAFWAPMDPSRFVGETLLVHGGIITAALVFQLVAEQRKEFPEHPYDFAAARAKLADLDRRLKAATSRMINPDDNSVAGWGGSYYEVKAERERHIEEMEKAEADEHADGAGTFARSILLFGVVVMLITAPMQERHYSGHPINEG